MTNDEIVSLTVQGARYLQAAQQDLDLNLRLTHLNYAVAYFEAVMRHVPVGVAERLTGIDLGAAMDLAQRKQNEVNLEYMRIVGIPMRVPTVG